MSRLLISLASLKGGVGKTTSAIHLAGCLTERQAGQTGKVAVVDRDRTRSATSWSRSGSLPFFVGTQDAVFKRADEFTTLVIDSRGGLENDELQEMAEASDFLLLPTNVEYIASRHGEDGRGPGPVGPPFLRRAVHHGQTRQAPRDRAGRAGRSGPARDDHRHPASEAFKDASEQSVLVRDVKTNRLAPQCWADYVTVTEEIFSRMEGAP